MDKKLELINNVEETNAMPNISLDLMSLISDPGTTISDISQKVKLDEALAAYILKNCNSPLYGIKNEITSIPQALTLLGFSAIRTILMSYFNRKLYNITGKNEINYDLWLHSVSVASFSQAIASHLDTDPEEAYLAGLLHDIGKLIIYSLKNTAFEEVLIQIRTSGKESFTVEENSFEFNHMEIGSLIMEKWKLSKDFVEVAQFHHSTSHYNNENNYISIVAFANLLAHGENDESQIDLSFFFNKYSLSEKKFEKIISKGLELKKNYISF